MSFDPAPAAFFGPGYSLASNKVQLATADIADITVAAFTVDGTTATLTFAAAHNLKVGDKVAISSATTLPSPFTAADHYIVSVPTALTMTISLTRNGTAIVSTDTGTGAHTLKALGALQEVTDAEGHVTTGDWRKIVYGIMELLHSKYINTPTADRPVNVTISKSPSTNATTGVTTMSYSVTIKTLTSASEVLAE